MTSLGHQLCTENASDCARREILKKEANLYAMQLAIFHYTFVFYICYFYVIGLMTRGRGIVGMGEIL